MHVSQISKRRQNNSSPSTNDIATGTSEQEIFNLSNVATIMEERGTSKAIEYLRLGQSETITTS